VLVWNGSAWVASAPPANAILFSATANATIANTTSELTMFGTGVGSLTLPANKLAAGAGLRINFWGYKTNPGSAGTVTIRMKIGGSTLATAVVTPGATTDTLVRAEMMITCRTAGVSGTVIGQGQVVMPESATANRYWDLVSTGTTVVDTTGTLVLDVTLQWASGVATRTVTITNGIVEFTPVA
jgi:hypothetical protein